METLNREGHELVCAECGERTPFKRRPKHKPGCSGPSGMETLSPLESAVAVMISNGLTSKEIGAKLGVAPKTVDGHRKAIFRALGVTTAVMATRKICEWEAARLRAEGAAAR